MTTRLKFDQRWGRREFNSIFSVALQAGLVTHFLITHDMSFASSEDGARSSDTVDITKRTEGYEDTSRPSTPVLRRHLHFHRPHFNTAYHRVVSRQDRKQSNDGLEESVVVTEESRPHPSEDKLYMHLSRAQIAIGYTHCFVVVIASAIFAALLIALAFAVASDISRKTRDRATEFANVAAECSYNFRSHQCTVGENGVSHPSSHEMTRLCKEWHTCAKRAEFSDADAHSAKVWAETLADIINTFAEHSSSSSLIVCAVVVFVFVFFCTSTAFNFFHQRSSMEQPSRPVFLARPRTSPAAIGYHDTHSSHSAR